MEAYDNGTEHQHSHLTYSSLASHGSASTPPVASTSNGSGRQLQARAGSSGDTPTPALDKDGQPVPAKKKRKQLVLRRVKCDKSDKGEADCTECSKKGINCTDSYVKSKPKVARTGKLIQQARKMFGGGDTPAPTTENADEVEGTLESKPLPIMHASEARLVTSELGLAISDHLVQTYLTVFQGQCHVVDWQAFSRNWDAAGRNSDRLSPSNECLALVIQAWGARFSDNPLVLGQEGAKTLPKLDDLREHVGRDFTEVGNRREKFARAMVDRALKKIDEKGALRKASAATCSALLLVEFLLTWENSPRDGTNYGRHMLVSVVEHLRSMSDASTYVSDDPEETPLPPEQVSGGTLLWMCYSRDALSSALVGRVVSMSSEDLAMFSDLLAVTPHVTEIMSSVTSTIPPVLSGLAVVSVFRHITTLIRTCAARVTGPMAQRARLDEAAVREIWQEIEQSKRYGAIFRDSVNKVDWGPTPPKTESWFRDLTVMRAQLILAMHRNIVDRLEAEQTDPRAELRDPGFHLYLEGLQRVKIESDKKLLDASREFALLARSYSTSLVHACSLGCEYATEYLHHLVSMPAWEEGGVQGWTWANKHEEINWLIDALNILGWCWSGYNLAIDNARNALLASSAAQTDYLRARSSKPTGLAGGVPRYTPSPFAPASQYPSPTSTVYSSYPPALPPPINDWRAAPTAPPQSTYPTAGAPPPPQPTYPTAGADFADSHLLHNPAFTASYPPADSYSSNTMRYGEGGRYGEEDSKDGMSFKMRQADGGNGAWGGSSV